MGHLILHHLYSIYAREKMTTDSRLIMNWDFLCEIRSDHSLAYQRGVIVSKLSCWIDLTDSFLKWLLIYFSGSTVSPPSLCQFSFQSRFKFEAVLKAIYNSLRAVEGKDLF